MDFKTLFSDPVLLLTGKDELLSFLIPWLMKMWRHVSKLKENTFQIMCLISEVTVETLNWNASYFNLSTAIPKDRVGQIVPSWCRTFFPELQLVNWLLHLWVSVHWSAWLSERGRKNTILKIQMLKNYFTCLVCGLVLTYLAFFFFLSVGIHQNQYFPSFRLHWYPMEHANIQQLSITLVLEQNICFCTAVIFLAEKVWVAWWLA